jgi:hypothetical protein
MFYNAVLHGEFELFFFLNVNFLTITVEWGKTGHLFHFGNILKIFAETFPLILKR